MRRDMQLATETSSQADQMDTFLFKSWQNSAPPFDGHVLCNRDIFSIEQPNDDDLSIEQLRGILNIAVDRLEKEFGDLPLVAVEDWHEHDGYGESGRRTTWKNLQGALVSNAALYDSRHLDWMVHRGFYPPGGAFLLRYFLDDEDAPGGPIWGCFDLAGPLALLKEILADCPDDLRARLRIESAKRYFDAIYDAA